jgi:BirA family biotin operon repressor/biotin-[acetyl-CoA-carboxylase] ligase
MMDWPRGVDHIALDTVESTMTEARNRASVLSCPTWISAKCQTAGTGRRGRAWDTGAGNFSASLIYRPKGEPADLALRSFVAALALFDALEALSGRADIFTLKWPNDVLLRGGKLAGILLESLPDGLIIGIGVNLKTPPPVDVLEPRALPPKTLLAETGQHITPEMLLQVLAPCFARREALFTTYGFAPIRQAWLARAAHLGKPIRARIGNMVLNGLFTTLDEGGALVLETPKGRHAISAGDVFFDEEIPNAAGD